MDSLADAKRFKSAHSAGLVVSHQDTFSLPLALVGHNKHDGTWIDES